jgi:hypothetical protein
MPIMAGTRRNVNENLSNQVMGTPVSILARSAEMAKWLVKDGAHPTRLPEVAFKIGVVLVTT